MKTLTLLRHAEAGWEPGGRDFDRPLTVGGRRAARGLGERLADESFDHVLASPARRVRETIGLLGAGRGAAFSTCWEPALYLAESETLLDHVRRLPPDSVDVLMVGHNPGLEELLALLLAAEGDDASRTFAPGAFARIGAVDPWSGWTTGTARLDLFAAP